MYRDEAQEGFLSSELFPAAIVTDIASNSEGQTLEIGTGKVAEVFCLVPVDGTIRIASGGVFSFYQFPQPSEERLTDTKWRVMMGIELDDDNMYRQPEKSTEDWTRDFQLGPSY